MFFLAIDFDGTIVRQDRPYDDLETPLELIVDDDGVTSKDALMSLKEAGHVLLLYSARSNRSLRINPRLDPLVRAGVRKINMEKWQKSQQLHIARYQQMLDFVAVELPGIFDAIDDGKAGKPVGIDFFIDDRVLRIGTGGLSVSWRDIMLAYGAT